MKLSPRLEKFYGGKKSFGSGSLYALEELLGVSPVSTDDIPTELADQLKFINDNINMTDAAICVFEYVANESVNIQEQVQLLSRSSSFLDKIVPFRLHALPDNILQVRDKLNGLRNLYTESLLNDDLITTRAIGSAVGFFSEFDNFAEFLRPFGEYVSSINLGGSEDSDDALNDFIAAMDNAEPGKLMSLALSTDTVNVTSQQVELLKGIRLQREQYHTVPVERNVLCWSLTRSYLDLPIRLLSNNSITPGSMLDTMRGQVRVLTEMRQDDISEQGINLLVEWSIVLLNSALMLAEITRIFTEVMKATNDLLWEFFFYQLSQLEELEEDIVLESVLQLSEQTLFKD